MKPTIYVKGSDKRWFPKPLNSDNLQAPKMSQAAQTNLIALVRGIGIKGRPKQ